MCCGQASHFTLWEFEGIRGGVKHLAGVSGGLSQGPGPG